MPDQYRLSILHVSDLHARSLDVDELPEGQRARRRQQVEFEEREGSRHDVLGERWEACLHALYRAHDERPDLVCFTGDVADFGLVTEYAEATSFVNRTPPPADLDVARSPSGTSSRRPRHRSTQVWGIVPPTSTSARAGLGHRPADLDVGPRRSATSPGRPRRRPSPTEDLPAPTSTLAAITPSKPPRRPR